MKKTGTSICNKKNGKLQTYYNTTSFLKAIRELNYPSNKAISEYIGCSKTTSRDKLKVMLAARLIERVMIGNTWLYRIKE